jgi:hypothetical protein
MKPCNPRYLAVIIPALAVLAMLAACENYNQSLKPEIEYNGAVVPVFGTADLLAAVAAIPPGGSGNATIMDNFAINDTVVIDGGKTVFLEAYSGTTLTAQISRAENFYDTFFDIQDGAALHINGGREKGTLVLDGGAASGLTAVAALVTVTDGVLTLGDRATLRNNSGDYYGGGVSVFDGSFTMTGGEISGNTVTGSSAGGGVFVAGGSFTMSGGSIIRNTNEYNGGGGVDFGGDTFTMTGGTIAYNTAANSGGGVSFIGGNFIMSGGNISGNRAIGGSGGGVFVYGSFDMTGGAISGNSAAYSGGGVYVAYGPFTKTGGIIYGDDDAAHNPGDIDNTATYGDTWGHAVYYDSGSGEYYRNDTLYAGDNISTDPGTLPAGGSGDTEGGWTKQ